MLSSNRLILRAPVQPEALSLVDLDGPQIAFRVCVVPQVATSWAAAEVGTYEYAAASPIESE